jgi:RNA polymerase sigma-70 factor (ECF subfamily)
VTVTVTELGTDLGPGDAELVRRALGGDRWAMEALYRRHVGDAARVATVLLRHRADAEDVVQDAFAAAFGRLAALRDPSAFGGWLARIVANEAKSRLRRRRFLGMLGLDRGDDEAALDRLAAPGASAEELAELAHLDRALRRLGAGERMAWVLRYVEGWRLAEIAEALEVSLATVKRRIAAAQAQLGGDQRRDRTMEEPE